jgi:hypothetical protein
MLPPLLALCGLPQDAVWRTSSGIIVAVIVLYGWTYPRRRRLKTLARLPLRRWLPITLGSAVVIVGLLAAGAVVQVDQEAGALLAVEPQGRFRCASGDPVLSVLGKRGRLAWAAFAAYRSAILASASRTFAVSAAAAISRNSSTSSRSSDCVIRIMAERLYGILQPSI